MNASTKIIKDLNLSDYVITDLTVLSNDISSSYIHKDGTKDSGDIYLNGNYVQTPDEYTKSYSENSFIQAKTIMLDGKPWKYSSSAGTMGWVVLSIDLDNLKLKLSGDISFLNKEYIYSLTLGDKIDLNGITISNLDYDSTDYGFITLSSISENSLYILNTYKKLSEDELIGYYQSKDNGFFTLNDSDLGHQKLECIYGCHVEGGSTKALGKYTHTEGRRSIAAGRYSHAEGDGSLAVGFTSHAEGWETSAYGLYSHSEGYWTKALQNQTHAEGAHTIANGNVSHAEGHTCKAMGYVSHAEGISSVAYGSGSHAEGYQTSAIGDYSHAEGLGTIASGYGSHAENVSTKATNMDSHAEGYRTEANGLYSHAEGYFTESNGNQGHSEGAYTHANGGVSHAEGHTCTADGWVSHASGYKVNVKSGYTYAWKGIKEDDNILSVDREGTFNIFPKGGINGFYIGDESLEQILDKKIPNTKKINVVLSNNSWCTLPSSIDSISSDSIFMSNEYVDFETSDIKKLIGQFDNEFTINDSTFLNSKNIKFLNINNVKYIGSNAFQKSTLEYCKIIAYNPDNKHYPAIGRYAFQGCTNLISCEFENTYSIFGYAFSGCTNLKNIKFSRIGDIQGYVFYNTPNLETIVVDTDIQKIYTNGIIEDETYPLTSLKRIELRNAIKVPVLMPNGINLLNDHQIEIVIPSDLIAAWSTAENWSTLIENGTIKLTSD